MKLSAHSLIFSFVGSRSKNQNIFNRMSEFVIADTEYGKVKGVKKTSVLNTVYNAFFGIKYATPPIGDLRFKDPIKPAKWEGVYDATQYKSGCYEMNTYVKKVIGSEDSLELNIYSKNINPSKLLPTMLYIHGGGFLTGSSSPNLYSPDYLLMADIVLVTFNYRMGALGFLSLKNKELNVPGNAGLKDQLMVMNFVKNNIQNFGGDSNNITLFGHSSAACCVSWHCVAQRSKGLFHKAIIMSGSILNSWSLTPHRDWANRLAKKLGFEGSEDEREILEFLQQADPVKIVEHQKSIIEPDEKIEIAFGPVIEHYTTEETFITETPINSLKSAWSNNMDMLIGGTSDEGLVWLKSVNEDENVLKNLKLESLIPPEIDTSLYKSEAFEFVENLKKVYYPTSNPNEDKTAYCTIIGDKSFWHSIHRTILGRQNSGGTGKTFLYRFAVDSPTHNFQRFRVLGPNTKGCVHADEITYLYKNSHVSVPEKQSMEFKATERFVSLFTSFASTGNPNDNIINADMQGVLMEPIDTLEPPFKGLEIGENVKFDIVPECDRLAIWDRLFKDTNTPLY